MQTRLSRYDFSRWVSDFLNSLSELKQSQREVAVRQLTGEARDKLIAAYHSASRRLFFLDYDGTLVGFASKAVTPEPGEELLELLRDLSGDPKNALVIISDRKKDELSRWLGNLGVILVAENGGWIREKGGDWGPTEPFRRDWQDAVRPILELYVDRTPGSFIEEKDFSLAWNFRRTEPELANIRAQELRNAVLNLIENLDLAVFEGSNVLEIKTVGINKGRTVQSWLAKQDWDFILASGDDYTDEDMFSALPSQAYSIKVGQGISSARFNVDSVAEIRLLLRDLLRC
jgi:trehalose 6-phosphate synthase/phosphatase